VAKKIKKQSKTYWRSVLRAQKKSGLGVAAFCRKKGIQSASLYAWRRRMGASGAERGPSKQEIFVPVQVVAGGDEARPFLELVLKNGRVLRLYREVAGPALAGMVQAVEAC
jgi:transposase-like protein